MHRLLLSFFALCFLALAPVLAAETATKPPVDPALQAEIKTLAAQIKADKAKVDAAKAKMKPDVERLKANREKMKAIKQKAKAQREAWKAQNAKALTLKAVPEPPAKVSP